MFLKGDLVSMLGCHGDGPEVTQMIGTIIDHWTVDGWWLVLAGDEVISWPEDHMTFLERS